MKKLFSIMLALAMTLSMLNVPMAQAATAVDIGEDWGIWIDDDCSTKDNWVASYLYNNELNSTYGYVSNAHKTEIYSVSYGNKFHAINPTLAVEGDFAAEFDLFVDDLTYSGESLTGIGCFRVGMYKDELTTNGNSKEYINSLLYQALWDWTKDELADDSGTKYRFSTARASKKFNTEATMTLANAFGAVSSNDTNKYLNMKFVSVGKTVSAYAKWNNSSKWINLKNWTISEDYDGKKSFAFHIGLFAGIDNFKIYRPESDIPKTPIEESNTWSVQSENDFSANTKGLTPYYSFYLQRNADHGFAYQGHSSNYEDGWNANHLTQMSEGVKGDYAVDFDFFINDIDIPADILAKMTGKNTFRMKVYSGALVKDGNYSTPSSVIYSMDNVWSWLGGKLADDNDTAYTYNTALASSKYISAPTDEKPAWLDMRIVLKGDVITAYAKWNTASNWRQLFMGTMESCDDYRGLMFVCGTNAGFDNFKILRPKKDIVHTPIQVTSTTVIGGNDAEQVLDGDADNMIVTPHFGTPSFTEPNGKVEIEFTNNTDVDFTQGTTDVYLSNEYKAWYAESTKPTKGDIYLGTKKGWKTTITVPSDISPELMNLEIVHTKANGEKVKYFAPQSVQVAEKLNQNFYSVAISDTHIDGMGNENAGAKKARIWKYFNDSLSVANPRYLSHSGDIHDTNIDDRATHVKETMNYAFQDAKVPFIVVAGNHEYDTYTLPVGEFKDENKQQVTYEEYKAGYDAATDKNAYKASVQVKNTFTEKTFDEFFGTKTAAITMGSDMLIAKNDFGAWKWQTAEKSDERYKPIFINLRDALAEEWNKSEYNDDYRVVYQHCYNTGEIDENGNYVDSVYGTASFMSPRFHEGSGSMTMYDAQYTGHYHETYVETDNVLTLGGDGKGGANWSGLGVISDFSYNADANGKKWTNSINDLLANTVKGYNASNVDYIQEKFIDGDARATKRAVRDEYFNKNDGTAEFNIATVTNTMDFNFYDGRVRFVMAPGKDYVVTNGEKLAQYDSYDGRKTIVLAKVNIPAATEEAAGVVNVGIKAADYAADELVLEGAETGFVGANVEYLDLASTSGKVFTASELSFKNNGFDSKITTKDMNSGVTRIYFEDLLVPNSSYTLTADGKEFNFVVLPSDAIVFLDNAVKHGSGYCSSAHGTAYDRMSIQTGTDTEGKPVYTYANDYNYENYILDYTVAMTGTLSAAKASTGFENMGVLWHIFSKNEAGETNEKRTGNGYEFYGNSERSTSFAQSILTKPVEIKAGYAYDFRIVKVGDTWKAYAKKNTDDRYDLILSLRGDGIYAGEGRTSVEFYNRSANTVWLNYKLYPIENKVTVKEKVGSEFDISFDIQPKDLTNVTIDGLGDVTFEKTGVKSYKATMPSTWTKKSDDAILGGISDIFTLTAPSATLSAAKHEIDFGDIVVMQDGKAVNAVEKGDYTVKVTCGKNYALPENMNIICASYIGKRMTDAKTVAPEDIKYNGSELEFNMTSKDGADTIKLFAFDMDTLAPLAVNAVK